MTSTRTNYFHATRLGKAAAVLGLCLALSTVGVAQDKSGQEKGSERNSDQDRLTKLEAGTVIPVRVREAIDVQRSDISAATVLTSKINRVYRGAVDEDIRGQNGHLAVPKGSNVELIVKVGHDNGLLLDLESVVVNGQRYALRAEPHHGDSNSGELNGGNVGEIMNSFPTGQAGSQAVNVPLNSVVTFRLKRAMDVGVADRGSDRDGIHYHEYGGSGR